MKKTFLLFLAAFIATTSNAFDIVKIGGSKYAIYKESNQAHLIEYDIKQELTDFKKRPYNNFGITLPSEVVYHGRTYQVRSLNHGNNYKKRYHAALKCVDWITLPKYLEEVPNDFGRVFKNNLKMVTLGDSTRIIEREAFAYSTQLSGVHNSKHLIDIGERAFTGCKSLDRIDLRNATDIGAYAFDNCRLDSICLANVEHIQDCAFMWNNHLRKVEFPEHTPVRIDKAAFYHCSALEYVLLWQGRLGDGAFMECLGLKRATIGCNSLGKSVFKNCSSLLWVNLLGDLDYIPEQMFYGCTSLRSVYFPSKIKRIERYAFSGTAFRGIDLMNFPITYIGEGAFADCDLLESVTLPSTITEIASKAFAGCTNLKYVQLSRNIEKLAPDAFDADIEIEWVD